MKNDEILADELMTDDELDQVTGGSSAECCNITEHILKSSLENEYNGSPLDGKYLKTFLSEKFGIEAEIDANGLTPNKYKDILTGKTLSHGDVLDKIDVYRTYNGDEMILF